MPQHINRRDFLRLAGLGGSAAVLGGFGPGGLVAARGPALPVVAAQRGRHLSAAADVGSRILVVLEMAGGNDGPSMAPPVDAERLWSLRPNAAHPVDSLLRPGNGVILHPELQRLQHRPLSLVDGVGSPGPDLSHFEMLRRWRAGDPDGTSSHTTGFLGRLCDVIDVGAPVTGLSVGGASTPALDSERAGTLGVPEMWRLWWLGAESDSWEGAFRDGLAAMSDPVAGERAALATARSGLATGLHVGDIVSALPDDGDPVELRGYPDSTLGRWFALVAQILAADLGVRVVHVPFDGDFDTHNAHRERHDELMMTLDSALDAFLADIETLGLADRLLVATTSEFGRRPEENGGRGLDHGTASTMLLAGPVSLARIGDPPSYRDRDLDENGNAKVTVSIDEYLATLADWLGVAPTDVLLGNPRPLGGIW